MANTNKKGTVATYFTALGLLLAIGVFLYYSGHTDKYIVNFGMNQTKILKTYQEGEKMLLYVDQAARLSMQQAAYELAKRGFYSEDEFGKGRKMSVEKGNNVKEDFSYWKDEFTLLNDAKDDCVVGTTRHYPDELNVKDYFWGFFQESFSEKVDAYNAKDKFKAPAEQSPKINNSYAGFSVSSGNGKTILTATAAEPVVIENKPVTYKVKPSFQQAIDLDLLGNLKTLKEKTVDKSQEEINEHDWDIKKSAYPGECVIISETSEEAATCCLRYEECEEEEKDADGKCPCEEYGKERVFRTYTKYDYAVSVDSGKSFFVLVLTKSKATAIIYKEVEKLPIVYKFALGWVKLGDISVSCVKVD